MNTIRNYLETMFQNLPNTEQVKRAKRELWQMMEDKYTELREEGKTENEAVGIVISEFGNLDELAEDLGISNVMSNDNYIEARGVSFEEAKTYVRDNSRHGFLVGLGVLLCITCPCGVILTESVWGLIQLFVFIAGAVGLFVFSAMLMDKWKFFFTEPCSIDFSTADYIHNERENFRLIFSLCITIGVLLCATCFIPIVVMDEMRLGDNIENIGVVVLLLMVAVGVFMFICAGVRKTAYDTLLKLNGASTMGGRFVSSQSEQVRYSNKTVAAVMSVYWPTVTCIYLSWSFLSGDWHFTWIVWVIAGVINTLIKNLCRE